VEDDSPDAPHETGEWLPHVVRVDPRGLGRPERPSTFGHDNDPQVCRAVVAETRVLERGQHNDGCLLQSRFDPSGGRDSNLRVSCAYSYHVFLLPLAVVAIVIAHVLLVRKHGIVPPFPLADRAQPTAGHAQREAERPPAPAPERSSVASGVSREP